MYIQNTFLSKLSKSGNLNIQSDWLLFVLDIADKPSYSKEFYLKLQIVLIRQSFAVTFHHVLLNCLNLPCPHVFTVSQHETPIGGDS